MKRRVRCFALDIDQTYVDPWRFSGLSSYGVKLWNEDGSLRLFTMFTKNNGIQG
jgi:hypothetical protein